MHFHWQNLTDGKRRGFWNGRCWLQADYSRYNGHPEVRFEWLHGKRVHHPGLSLHLGGGDTQAEIALHICIAYVLSWWLVFDAYPHFQRKDEREIGVSWFDGSLWISLWNNPNKWNRRDPWWQHISIDVPRLLFGPFTYTSTRLEEGESVARYAEPTIYKVKWVKTLDVWKRPRWFAKRVIRFHLDMEPPIPIPGKGESDWDLGEDAIWSLTLAADAVGEALHYLDRDVERIRRRYGGTDWLPEAFQMAAGSPS